MAHEKIEDSYLAIENSYLFIENFETYFLIPAEGCDVT